MIVFNTYFKIVKRYIHLLFIYTAIFIVLSILLTSGSNTNIVSFEAVNPSITIINEDKDSTLIKTLTEYLGSNSEITQLSDNISREDAIFFRYVNYILIIPEGFTEGFMSGNDVRLDSISVADSTDSMYAEMLINRFLNIAKVYVSSNMSEEVIKDNILNDLDKEIEVNVINNNENINTLNKAVYFFNFTNYLFLAFLISIIGMIMDSFKKEEIHKRNAISALSVRKLNGQLLLSNLVISLLVWLLYMILSIILYGSVMFTINGLLLMLNSLIFIICALSIAFMVGSFIRGEEAISGISNIISLGTSFLCGAFVPQELLGSSVLNVSKILPSYYFIKNNNDIAGLANISFDSLKPIIINMVIILIYGIVIYIVTNIIARIKLKKYN